MTNLKIVFPHIPLQASDMTLTPAGSELYEKNNSITGERFLKAELNSSSTTATYWYDLGVGGDLAVDHFVMARADIPLANDLTQIALESSPDNAVWTTEKTWGTGPTEVRTTDHDPAAEVLGEYLRRPAHDEDLSIRNRDFTLCGWVKFDDLSVDRPIISKWITTGVQNRREYSWEYSQSANVLRWRFVDYAQSGPLSGLIRDTSFVPTVDTWIFWVVTHNSVTNVFDFYINDSLDSSQNAGGGVNGQSISNIYFAIGAKFDGIVRLDGRESAIGVWHRTLTAAERTWLYNAGVPSRDFSEIGTGAGSALGTNLVAWWQLDEFSDGTVAVQRNDDSVSAYHMDDIGTTPSTNPPPGGSPIVLYGQRHTDVVDSFAPISAKRYWRVVMTSTTPQKFSLSKIYFGTAFDFGREPHQVELVRGAERREFVGESGTRHEAQVQENRRTYKVTWRGVSDALLRSFISSIGSHQEHPVFLFTTTQHELLDDDRVVHCTVARVQYPRVWDDYNEVTVECREVIG